MQSNKVRDLNAKAPHRRSRTDLTSVLYTTPALLIMLFVALTPMLYIAYFSVAIDGRLGLDGYREALHSGLVLTVFWNSLQISTVSALVAVLIAYPISLHISAQPAQWQPVYLGFVLLPFWTSILVKSFAFAVLLGREGLVNTALVDILGLGSPLPLLYNRFGVVVGMLHYILPFVVLPLTANLLGHDPNLTRAAEIMGAKPATILWKITIPLSVPAAAAGGLIAMILAFGSFITPALLGGRKDAMLGNVIDIFTRETLNWTMASVIAMVLLAATSIMLTIARYVEARTLGR